MLKKFQFTLTQIEYTLAVHKLGHFAKAAQVCNISQPTLSMQIQKLEEDLGVIIFDRSKKPILLTAAGEKVIAQMQSIVFESRKLEEIIGSMNSNSSGGEIILGVIPTVAPYILPRLLPELEKSNPQLRMQIMELQTHQIIDALETDEINVGLLATPINQNKIYEHALYYEPFTILCQKQHELSQFKKVKYSHLKYEDIWLLQEGHCLRNQVIDICSLKQNQLASNKYHFESGSLETLKNLIDKFGGYTLLPWLAMEQIGSNSLVIQFERPIPSREIGLVYRREHYKGDLIEAIGEAILRSIPEELSRLRKKDLDILPVDDSKP